MKPTKPKMKPTRDEVLALVRRVGVSEAARISLVPKGTVGRWAAEAGVKRDETGETATETGSETRIETAEVPAKSIRGEVIERLAEVVREPGRAGRPTIYTDEIGEKIAEAVERGLPLDFAGPLAGVSRATGHNWRARGKEGEQPFVRFLERLEIAEALFLDKQLAAIEGAQGGKDAAPWTNHAWLAERRHPHHFSRTIQQVEHSGAIAVIKVDLPNLPPDLTPEERMMLARAGAGKLTQR